MEIEKESKTKRVEFLVEGEDEVSLQNFLRELLHKPLLLKDVLEYVDQLKENCQWLRSPTLSLERIWLDCYLKKFPKDIPAIFEYHYFSQNAIGKSTHMKYGIIDVVLRINYSNSKGFDRVNKGVEGFFLSQQEGTVRDRLYPDITEDNENALLNPDMSQWKEWRMYHFKMRLITLHFLLFLIERVPSGDQRLLMHYGFYLERSFVKFIPNQVESKLDFFLPSHIELFQDSLLKDESRVALLRIIEDVNSGELGRDDMVPFTQHLNMDTIKEWMCPLEKPLSSVIRDRCL